MITWAINHYCIIGEQPYFTVMRNNEPVATFFSKERAERYIAVNS